MTKKRINLAKRKLAESAFDFLTKSVDEIKSHPKYAVIHFATAVELLLKARLMNEHWTLVVEKASEVSLDDFLAGKCKTVTQADAIRRLENVCGEMIPKDIIGQFAVIAAHRNRMIHFFHDAGAEDADQSLVEAIVKEQCRCWFHLERLLAQWDDQFEEFASSIATVRFRMRRNRSYLAVAFERLKSKIDAQKTKGTVFQRCSGCGFEAASVDEASGVLFHMTCEVCGLTEAYVEVECPGDCGNKLKIRADSASDRTCEVCEYQVTASHLSDKLDTEYRDLSDPRSAMNCAYCMGSDTVVQHHDMYVCTECLETSDKIEGCQWCNELQMGGGDLEFSYHSGCEFCDGQAGWTSDD